mmetsp:Transcript_23512/g.39722  ORF Transcript_23512/g.39722 Transcript_23512/m.39722 type:complete len:108 (-) Transcript_23512:200-523(-)
MKLTTSPSFCSICCHERPPAPFSAPPPPPPRPQGGGGDQKGGGDEETKGKFYSAREVARYTAESCFKAADRDQTGQVSFDEFKVWFNSSSSSDIHEMVSPRSSSRNS